MASSAATSAETEAGSNVRKVLTIEDLPDEVLEFIMCFLPPYEDIHDCMRVSKRWRKCVHNVIKIRKRNLMKAIADFDIAFKALTPAEMVPTITKRYSHTAAVIDNSMYVFGGCTCSMTTFNDLWRLNLSKRTWVRPLSTGTYPSPKACSTMVPYKDSLVLFGGWTYPPTYPLHQSWHLFNELHTYDVKANRWTCINTAVTPPPTAGHSVSVHGHWMVIFGGLQRGSNVVHSTKTNDIWKLNLETWNWYKQETLGHVKPHERYGQSQTVLDDENVLIMGGSGGPAVFLSDIWVLNMTGKLWRWIRVDVRNSKHAPPNLWCNPACKIADKVIVFGKNKSDANPYAFRYYSRGVWVPPVENPPEVAHRGQARIDMADRVVDQDENVNGRRGTLKGKKRANERQERLKLAEEMIRGKMLRESNTAFTKARKNASWMYVLDVSHALDAEPYVEWQPFKEADQVDGPEETVLYTLVSGKSEMIMFGGIHKECGSAVACTTNLSTQVSNSLHFITAPSYVI